MESFFHALKADLVMLCDYKTRDKARASLFDYLEVFLQPSAEAFDDSLRSPAGLWSIYKKTPN